MESKTIQVKLKSGFEWQEEIVVGREEMPKSLELKLDLDGSSVPDLHYSLAVFVSQKSPKYLKTSKEVEDFCREHQGNILNIEDGKIKEGKSWKEVDCCTVPMNTLTTGEAAEVFEVEWYNRHWVTLLVFECENGTTASKMTVGFCKPFRFTEKKTEVSFSTKSTFRRVMYITSEQIEIEKIEFFIDGSAVPEKQFRCTLLFVPSLEDMDTQDFYSKKHKKFIKSDLCIGKRPESKEYEFNRLKVEFFNIQLSKTLVMDKRHYAVLLITEQNREKEESRQRVAWISDFFVTRKIPPEITLSELNKQKYLQINPSSSNENVFNFIELNQLIQTIISTTHVNNVTSDLKKKFSQRTHAHIQRILESVPEHGVHQSFQKVLAILKSEWKGLSEEGENLKRKRNEKRPSNKDLNERKRKCTIFINIVLETVQRKFDEHAIKLGYCCGRTQYEYSDPVFCSEDQKLIKENEYYENEKEDVIYCRMHHKSIPGKEMRVERTVKNYSEVPITTCTGCERKWHLRCVRPETALACSHCAENIPQLCNSLAESGFIIIANKFLLNLFEKYKVFVQLREFYVGEIIEEISNEEEKQSPLHSLIGQTKFLRRIIGAFQDIENRDVLIAVFSVQEFGTSDPFSPKNNTANLEYFDTNHHYQVSNPTDTEERTDVYHQILLAYYSAATACGYTVFHIYACPPTEKMNYLIRGRSKTQLYPTKTKLCGFYDAMIGKGIELDIFQEKRKDFKFSDENSIKHTCEMFYFPSGWLLNQKLNELIGRHKENPKAFHAKMQKLLENSNELIFMNSKDKDFVVAPYLELFPSTLFNCRLTYLRFQEKSCLQFESPQDSRGASRDLIIRIFRDRQEKETEERKSPVFRELQDIKRFRRHLPTQYLKW